MLQGGDRKQKMQICQVEIIDLKNLPIFILNQA